MLEGPLAAGKEIALTSSRGRARACTRPRGGSGREPAVCRCRGSPPAARRSGCGRVGGGEGRRGRGFGGGGGGGGRHQAGAAGRGEPPAACNVDWRRLRGWRRRRWRGRNLLTWRGSEL